MRKRERSERGKMSENNKDMPKDVPYIVHEGAMARNERLIKRLIIAITISIILLFACNGMWLYAWMQYDYGDVTLDSNDGGNASFVGADGDIINGNGTGEDKAPKR